MSIEALKTVKDQIMSCVQSQVGDLSKVDAHELGEAIDMIKDLSEAIYYCTITESMEKAEEKQPSSVNNITYYTTPITSKYPEMYYRDMERTNGYMYYGGNGGNSSSGGSSNSMGSGSNSSDRGTTPYLSEMMRDPREGRSPIRRRMYMEGKQMHNDTNSQMKELETYLQQLSTDITEMIKDASPEEKAILRQKMNNLASKIV